MIKEVSERIKYTDIKLDVLEDVLETLRFRGSIFFHSRLAAPWGMSLENIKAPRFHIALDGDFVIGTEIKSNEIIHVKHMDIAMLPKGDMHWIADQANRQLIPSSDASMACELGTPLFQRGKPTHKLICGIACYDDQIFHPILDSLPPLLHFSNIQVDDPIWMTATSINKELKGEHIGRAPIINRLTEVLFLQLLNEYILNNKEVTGFFLALRNKRVYQVLKLIHQDPKKPWTLKLLGEKTGMSRATLIRQFNQTLGTSPMEYMTNWRMAKAFYLLKYSSKSLDDIAEQVGFSTARTLNKAFQRHYGFTPNELRHK